MTHREKALWAVISGLIFALTGGGLLVYGVRSGNDATIPSVFACVVIAFSLAVYSSRELIRHQKEARSYGPPPPEDDGPTEARSSEDHR